MLSAVDIIRKKRDGASLSDDEIRWFIDAYTGGEVADEQAAALLMAIFLRGLDETELSTWTGAMIQSGERLDLSASPRPTVDKHSTGGVGDKVSLVLAPMMAACGAAVPMLSGRGLGHTGGTLDKLESIPGFTTDLDRSRMLAILSEVGCVIAAAGADLAPADRKLYALRDVTGTVESIPLIASSIMSKKIAEGTEALVLDVKVGAGAFLPDERDARELARTLVNIGTAHGVKTSALLTDMEVPLGRAVGNALEVTESLDTLRGEGPEDLVEVTVRLASEMLSLIGIDSDPSATLKDGSAMRCFEAMVDAQGGNLDAPLPRARERAEMRAPESGYVVGLDARAIGLAAWRLGAGRARKEDPVSPGAGLVCLKKPGDRVQAGETLLELHGDDAARIDAVLEDLPRAVQVDAEPPPARQLVLDRITA